MKKLFTTLVICLLAGFISGQEFPIAIGTDTTFTINASFDGTNYLVAIKGDNQSSNNATAQFVSTAGNLVGSRILLGSNLSSDIYSAFDGTNYLLVWVSKSGNIVGQFLSPNGNLIGAQITIATNVSLNQKSAMLSYNAGSYFVCYYKGLGNLTYLWGRTISPNGTLGNEVQISNSYARDGSISFSGTKYLISYAENGTLQKNDLYARFVSPSGLLIGNEITIASGPFRRDNPTSLAFDGTKFLLAYHEQDPNVHVWFLYGRFIDTTGVVQNNFMVCDSSYHPMIPMVAFGNNKYLITWTQESNGSLMGQFYDTTGNQNGSSFIVFNTLNNKFPVGAPTYVNNNFVVVSTRLDGDFTNGDIYMKFITSTTGLSDVALQNRVLIYPNPATNFINIHTNITDNPNIELNIYNVMGTLVKSKSYNHNTINEDVTDLVNGIYTIEMKSSNWITKQKIVIQR